MMAAPLPGLRDIDAWTHQALTFEDGHLFIGRGGPVLCFGRGARLKGTNVEAAKTACIAAGLAVIDIRSLDVETGIRVARDEPRPDPGERVDARPFYGWAYGPLRTLAALYHAAGAEVINMPDVTGPGAGTGA